jgi:hypothetical protein
MASVRRRTTALPRYVVLDDDFRVAYTNLGGVRLSDSLENLIREITSEWADPPEPREFRMVMRVFPVLEQGAQRVAIAFEEED